MALQWTLLPIIVETDCLEMVQLIHSDEKAMSDLAFLIREVKLLLKGNREIVIKKSKSWSKQRLSCISK